jgi:hypothetical protein
VVLRFVRAAVSWDRLRPVLDVIVTAVVFYLVYVSSATALFSRAELAEILETSRRRNAARGISGALLYKDGNLMQVLEGDESAVRALYDTIRRDPRHQGLITVMDGYEETRQFAEWSMAYRDIRADETSSLPGYSHFLNTPLTAAEFGTDPTLCQQLLTTFKESLSPTWAGNTAARQT